MLPLSTMLFSLLSLTLVPLATSAPIARETVAQSTDRLLFRTSISAFQTARNAQNPRNLDWSSDACSSSPDNPFGFDFKFSCHRHDFGYRNYKAQSRFTDDNKLRIDNNFRTDLYNQCARESQPDACRDTADIYYQAVRWFGKREEEFIDPETVAEIVELQNADEVATF